MLKRKALQKLEQWKTEQAKKSLIVSGARQVGKTFIIREFGKQYGSFIEINFLEQPGMCRVFKNDLSADQILMGIRLMKPDAVILDGNTLLFLDEIQECPEAITALKFLAEDPRISVVASGSALGMAYNRVTSFPVGYVEYLDMHALDFEEFLWAMNIGEDIIGHVREHFENLTPVEDLLHEKFMGYLRQYMSLGGMPEVVAVFQQKADYHAASEVQKRIYRDYLSDIARFAQPSEKLKAELCYRSIPAQLMKENHKFQYSVVEHKGTARKFESSVDWLESAHLTASVNNVNTVEYPLKLYEMPDSFRLYTTDIGLFVCTFDYSLMQAILEDGQENGSEHLIIKTAKGGLYEALVADILTKSGHKDLFFYRNDTAKAEIEFLIEGKDGVLPIEVKAGRNKTKSLDNLLKKETIRKGYKLAKQNVGQEGKKITLPLYMAMWI